ncbi:MAG TPA: hypothetical protein VFB12_11675 [Ktedonobacteraceae bacterium]|nr:hypothetical protein [Ktedonobacteraceae bacterium]
MEKNIPNNLLPTQCYYCKARQAERNGTAKISMYGNIKRAYRKVEYQRTEIPVPRCLECKRLHTLVTYCSVIVMLPLLLIAVGLGVVILPPAYLVVGLFFAALIAVVVGLLLGNALGNQIFLRPRNILTATDITAFPPAQRMIQNGWTLNRPSP